MSCYTLETYKNQLDCDRVGSGRPPFWGGTRDSEPVRGRCSGHPQPHTRSQTSRIAEHWAGESCKWQYDVPPGPASAAVLCIDWWTRNPDLRENVEKKNNLTITNYSMLLASRININDSTREKEFYQRNREKLFFYHWFTRLMWCDIDKACPEIRVT